MEDSESLSQNEIRILGNLQELEKVSLQKDHTEEEVDRVINIINETMEWIGESIESSDVELPLQIMDLLEYLDTVVCLLQENRLQQATERF